MISKEKVWLFVPTIVILVIAGAAVYAYQTYVVPPASNSNGLATTTMPVGEGYSISNLPQEELPAAPNYKETFTFPPTMEAGVKAAINQKLTQVRKELDINVQNFDAWIELGRLHLIAENYEKARMVWEYTSIMWPQNVISYNNLGDLYMNYLKDYPKAEANYRKMIALAPNYIDSYFNLYTLYKYLYKTDTTAAADIVAEGLSKNPNNEILLNLKAELNAAQ